MYERYAALHFAVAQTWYGPRGPDPSLWRAAAPGARGRTTPQKEKKARARGEEKEHRAESAEAHKHTQTMESRTTNRTGTLADNGMRLLATFLILYGLAGELTVSLSVCWARAATFLG